MADSDLLEHDDVVEQGGEGRERKQWMDCDSAARIFVDEVTRLIAARLGQGDAPEWEMMTRLDGVPATVILTATDALGVVVARGVWKFRRRA